METRVTLKALFFDIDDTLYSTTEFAERARRNSIRAMIQLGLDVDEEVALRELYEVIAEFSSNYDKHYDKFLRRLPPRALGDLNPAILLAAGVVAYHQTKFRELKPFPDAEQVMRAIREKTDLVLGIITEGLEVKQAEKILRLDVYRHLDPRAIFISDQVGISKPNPKLYRHVLEKLGIGGPEAMYVGDNPLKDIEPAASVGMVTVRYRGSGGKHADEPSPAPPDYEIRHYDELLAILREDFGLSV